ncbi:hypothetical protein ACEPAI_7297 [Sanghuangporus weigelae]
MPGPLNRPDKPTNYRIIRKAHPEPLTDLPKLPIHPPHFTPGRRFTQERFETLEIDPTGFLSADEEGLAYWTLRQHEDALAWDETEKGSLDYQYFAPVLIPTVDHTPWVMKNIPIPPGIFNEVVRIIKDKIKSGVYEPSNSSYRSRWFCVVKKDGKSLRLVHDLQPLNKISIRDPSVPYPTEHIAETFGGHACYTMLDLFVAFDQRKLDVRSRDLTTFQTPLGAFRLTSIPMGYTNSQQIMHADVTFILKDEIPHVCIPYIDDIPVKGPKSRYELGDGSYETIPGNPNIRRFIWEHLNDVNRVLQRLKVVGATVSGKKLIIAAPEAVIVGHTCNYAGRVPDASRVKTITDWPAPQDVHDVRAFLGTAGVLRHFVKDYARLSAGLNKLLCKDQPFFFDDDARRSMDLLKHAVAASGAIRSIDYESRRPVHFCVDSSIHGYGAILLQLSENDERIPSRFIALYEARIYLVGIDHFYVEVDASYIKGMINNPDLQPNATINRWIAGILLFNFTIIHTPASKHLGPDGLSRRGAAETDPPRDEGFEDWIDHQYSFLLHDLAEAAYAQTEVSFELPDHKASRKGYKIVDLIREFLAHPSRPADLSESQFKQFVRRATRFFLQNGQLYRRNEKGRAALVVPRERRTSIMKTAHDELGHKGFFSVRTTIQDRFWWPGMHQDIKWYIKTCHRCQTRQFTKIYASPKSPDPAPLFSKVHIDVMMMPPSGGFKYIVQARDSLTGYPEFRMLRKDNAAAIARFVFEDILSRWGRVEELVTDNGASFAKDLPPLLAKYNVQHIRISPYNSRANGIIERRHRDLRETLMKLADADPDKWSQHIYHAIWAERITIQRRTGYSPYFMAHGVEPILPFDLAEATYISPTFTSKMTETQLIAARARALQKRPEDLKRVKESVVQGRFRSIQDFEKAHAATIKDYNFAPGALVLVRNSQIENELNRKTKPKYLGPMVVVRRTKGGSYILAEVSGAISALRYAAFRVIPYHARTSIITSVEDLTKKTAQKLDNMAREPARKPATEHLEEDSDSNESAEAP